MTMNTTVKTEFIILYSLRAPPPCHPFSNKAEFMAIIQDYTPVHLQYLFCNDLLERASP